MAKTYEPLATTTLSSTQSTVTFSSISGSYTDLVLVTDGTSSAADYTMTLQFNSDTGANYSSTILNGSSSPANPSSTKDNNNSSVFSGSITTTQSSSIISIQNYANTTNYKTLLARGNAGTERIRLYIGLWRNTNAINSITLGTNGTSFASGCTFTLYGILKA